MRFSEQEFVELRRKNPQIKIAGEPKLSRSEAGRLGGIKSAEAKSQERKSEIEEEMAQLLDEMGIAYDREQCLIPGRNFRVDFAIRDRKVVIEVEGLLRGSQGRHQTIEGMSADAVKYNTLAIDGYTVLRFTGRQIKSEKQMVRETIRSAVG